MTEGDSSVPVFTSFKLKVFIMITSCACGVETLNMHAHGSATFLILFFFFFGLREGSLVCPMSVILDVFFLFFFLKKCPGTPCTNERRKQKSLYRAVGWKKTYGRRIDFTFYWKKKNVSCNCSGLGLLVLHDFNAPF